MYLDAPITMYRTCFDNQGEEATFADFLRACMAAKDTVARYREATADEQKQMKPHLKAATLSGYFTPTRKAENLIKHSGLICIDIDHVQPQAVMDELRQIDNILYCSRSVSGNGVFAVIPLAYPNKHKRQLKALQKSLGDIGIIIDAQCCDVSRLRVISHDPEAYLNLNAVPYNGLFEEPRKQVKRYIPRNATSTDEERVARCVEQVSQDLTSNYQDWIEIGLSLASMGEIGRGYYHRLSSFHPKYNQRETDRKFDNLLKTNRNQVGLGTFFQIMDNYGYKWKQ